MPSLGGGVNVISYRADRRLANRSKRASVAVSRTDPWRARCRVPSLACQGQWLRRVRESRHDVARKSADVLARAAESDAGWLDPTLAHGSELGPDCATSPAWPASPA